MATKEFTVYRTHHGPIVREEDGKWVAVRADGGAGQGADPVVHPHQGQDYTAFKQTMELHTNSSNNTIFADADGDIAYFHSQLHPQARPEVRLDASRSTAAIRPPTGKGLLSVDETPERR